MSEIDMENKLRRVLFTFLEPSYEIRDEMYLEKLLVHISEGSGTAGEARTAVCEEWLQELVKVCMGRTLHSSVTAFTLRVVALMVKDPERFRYLYKEQILDKVIQLFKLKFLDNVGVRQAYITLLSALVKHSGGCDYLITSELWKDAVQFCHEDTSIYVSREGMKFITEFLNFLLREDCSKVDAVLNLALGPLTSNSKKLIPALEMTVKILEAALFGSETCRLYGKLDRFNLDSLGWSILNNTEEKEILEKVAQLLTVLYFTSLQCQNKTSDVTYFQFNEFQSKLYNLLTVLITRRLIPVFVKVLVHSQFYWHKTAIEVPQESDRRRVVFEIQLIILQILPVLSTVVNTKASENECMDSYLSKLFDITSESTQRLGYCGRDIITLLDNAPELAHMAVVNLMLLKDIMTRDQAVIVFQTMMYTLKDFLPNFNKYVFFGEGHEGYEDNFVIQNPELLSCVLEMVTSLIHCFNITWRDSVETICLFTMLILLLRNSHLTSKLAVQTLQLMLEVIQNFMPPNLALLVNTMEGSSIGQLGPVLYRRMHDTSWEVRDSALEVLRVVSSIAEDKFTAFQDHLLDNDLCSLCVVIVENDSESYVRASGLSCLGAMVRVSKYWSNSLASHDLPGKMIACLRKESEGIVRREAAALMKEMYELRKIPNSMLGEVFQTMADAAVGDLHWEVQINSLCFWSKVIEQELSDQGMIDGTFPSVTFSRVDRKIVTLTANEIKSRLGKALDKLSRLGCLQVLLATLEDCNLQVVQKSVEIVTSLYKLLSQYGVLAARSSLPDLISSNCLKKDQSDKPLPIFDTFAHEHSRLDKPSVSSRSNGDVQARLKASDEVIESIIQENDMRLLQEVYSNKVNDVECKGKAVHHRTVSADEFITALLQLNLTDVVAERTRWLGYCSDDLGSLLDDILASQIERESNAIDCY